ncbi:MAG: DUF5606 domain-containing protein [Bacteroidetes bacterium]|nr:DUF5606 domain-containing protein [Bacteroidota bacterium]
MDLSKIVSIAGKPGLYKVIGSGKNSILVESLIDGKRFPAFTHQRISALEEIAVFTTSDDRPLKEVFRAMHDQFGLQPDFDYKKLSPDQMAEKFAQAVPDYDTERVYPNDIKKAFSWYVLLAEKGLLDFKEDTAHEENNNTEPAAE